MRYIMAMFPLVAGLLLGGGALLRAEISVPDGGSSHSAPEDSAIGGEEEEMAGTAPEDPATQWVSAYAWVQTGRDLGESEQWPLAQACFLEARRQMAEVAEFHPGFEPELVRYRIKSLGEDIAGMEDQLANGDHEVMMKFLDFIETFERGEEQRYANEFQAAYETLDFARGLLEEVEATRRDPEGTREALAPQRERIAGHLEWLTETLDRKRAPSRPVSDIVDVEGVDWGTTEFVGGDDLPQKEEEKATANGEDELSPELFPGDLFSAGDPRERRSRTAAVSSPAAVTGAEEGAPVAVAEGQAGEKTLAEQAPEEGRVENIASDLPQQFHFRLSTREDGP